MIKLSQSTLNLFLECPRCFWLSVVKNIKRPRGPFPSLPSGIDLILKDYFNLYREKGEIPKLLRGKIPGKIITSLPASFSLYEEKIGALLYGRLDECLEIEDNVFAPLDHKTRGFKTKEDSHTFYQTELDVYTLLLEANHYSTKRTGFLVFYVPQKSSRLHEGFPFEVEVKEVPTNPEKAKEDFYKAVEVLRRVDPPKSSERCEYCKWARSQQTT